MSAIQHKIFDMSKSAYEGHKFMSKYVIGLDIFIRLFYLKIKLGKSRV